MRRLLLIYGLLLILLPVRAQPGGGGGIGFRQLYGRVGGQLRPITWEAAHARVFYLAAGGKQPVGPHTSITTEEYSPNFEHLYAPAGMRLLLVFQADTMLLDLTRLLEPNGAGFVHRLDSLVVIPGYFGFADSLRYESDPAPGLTPHSLAALRARRQLTYRPRTNLDFLAPDRLGANYYLTLAQHHLRWKRPNPALAALDAAEARQPSLRKQANAASMRATAYQQLGQYATAVRWATQALNLTRPTYHGPRQLSDGTVDYGSYYMLIGQYHQRQHLYLLQRDYAAALADYDAAAALYTTVYPSGADQRAYRIPAAIDRALFLADSLHQPDAYPKAIQLLHQQLQPQERASVWPCDRKMHHQISSYRELNATNDFFRLGTAEYRVGQYKAAFGHWYQALAGGHAYQGATALVVHFDSVLQRHPRQPLLLLGRAVAYLSNYEYPTRTEADRQKNLEHALADLAQAEAVGYTAADVLYYQALIFKEQERWADMRRVLDAAIAKVPTAGELYSLRLDARFGLREITQAAVATDPDWLTYQRLCPGGR